ncbi:surface lipoprotein assembly modifier [Pseudoponticoccus marisrubri]|nr:surface lipoprotein assembly modifier [Pseudoponticoccus marisrubri]
MFRRSAARLALIAALAAPPPAAATGEETRLSLSEARGAAARLLHEGRAASALVLADGVLLGDPDDVQGLLLRSRALRDMGRPDDALEAAQAAWQQAGTGRDRFFTAMVLAQAQASGGNKAVAQYWLRRAAQIAPDDRLRAVAVRDFRHVRRITPWRLSVDLTFQPSDNINGAPKTNTFTFAGLPFVNPTAVPVSGLRYGADVDYVYRVGLDKSSRLNLGVGLEVERVRLSSSAKRKLPGLRASDFREDALSLSLGYERRGGEGRWLGAAELSVTRRWVAGELLSDALRLQLSHDRVLAPRWEMGARLAGERDHRHDLAARSSTSTELGFDLTHRFDHGALRLDLMGAETRSDSRSIARDTRRVALAYALARPVKGMLPRVVASYEEVDFDLAPASFWTEPRRDREYGLALDVLLPGLDYYGFAPEIGVSWSDRRSNYSLYETEGTDLRLGLRSVF